MLPTDRFYKICVSLIVKIFETFKTFKRIKSFPLTFMELKGYFYFIINIKCIKALQCHLEEYEILDEYIIFVLYVYRI